MVKKRLLAFVVVVVVLFGVIAWTSPSILKEVKLGLDLKGGFEVLYEATPFENASAEGGTGGGKVTSEALKETAKSLEKRINASGVAEPEVLPEGTNRIRVRLAGVTNEEEIRELLKKPINLTFRAPDGTIKLDGTDFKENSAKLAFDDLNRPVVTIELKDAQKFTDVTTALVGSYLAIYLDDEEISRPSVNYPITGGSAQISVGDRAEAENLRDLINMGSLPLKLTEKYQQSVGAKLGLDSLKSTVTAGIIGSLIVLAFMIIVYRVPGFVAGISIITYAWLLILVHNWMGATLTLPGIAAFVLGVGIAVDANIITAERIKEEIRSGKSMFSSLKAGSKSSFRTIMDANVTSIIASVALYVIGDGAIKGFALTMIFSIIVSVLTNIYLSRFLLTMLVSSNAFMKPKYYGVKEEDIRAL
ncbi:MAG: protein translocase subunit SecD [Candidatus Pristimantibacillus lignocellulolyticus]|uniref:Protein translocase subunit SecD n=1 Tax=Candidatus Pristimantibacillus lignocellulolyticus TaxID=2994561 RepID=A0A9J6ZA94_9BACL|nr:MAG: protein translocase subunit SecD [Candidatus Pristimantibacillus lignocellulolyticus]